jgi:tetratricopeptide (TPR) repeat protein
MLAHKETIAHKVKHIRLRYHHVREEINNGLVNVKFVPTSEQAADILESEKESLGKLMTLEMGKTLRSAIDEAVKCAWGCRYYAENAERFLADEVIETNLGEALNATGQAEEALRHFEIAKALDPHCYLAYYNIGHYLLEHGRAGESVPEFEAAIRYSGSPQNTLYAVANLGEAYLLLEDNAKAERAFSEALRLDPNSFPALLGRGQALLRMKQYGEAEADIVQALRVRPQPELFYLLGTALEGEQKFDIALRAYAQALQLSPGMGPAQVRMAELQRRNLEKHNPPPAAPPR